MRLRGQTAVVTGGGKGIGRATCLALTREGTDIVVVARTEKDIRETARMVEKEGRRALAVSIDVRIEEDAVNDRNIHYSCYEIGGGVQVYAVCPASVDMDMYLSLYSYEPVLKPEDAVRRVLELFLPDTTFLSGSLVDVYRHPVRVM